MIKQLTPKQKRNKANREQLINLMNGKTVIVIPRELILFGETYKTKIQKRVLSNGESVNGYINHTSKSIYLKSRDGADKTYIHEVIHARDKFFGLKQNVPIQEKESLVSMEAEWWLQFFRQIFPIAELINKTDITKTTSDKDKLIKKLQLAIKRKDKRIETLKLNLSRRTK